MHGCTSLIAACIDFRFQEAIDAWIRGQNLTGDFDRVGVAGAAFNKGFLVEQLTLSKKLHNISVVYLLGHEDCGAFNHDNQAVKDSLNEAEKVINDKLPGLKVYKYYITIDKEFQPLS